MQGGEIQFRLDAPDGDLLGQVALEKVLTPTIKPEPIFSPVKTTEGVHDIYVLFKPAEENEIKPVGVLFNFEFLNKKLE